MPLDAQTWAQVRMAYEANEIPVRDICLSYGIPHLQLYQRLRAEGWTLRSASRHVVRTNEVRRVRNAIKVTRRDLISRLYAVINLKLTQLEKLMESETPADAVNQERHTRSINGLVRSLERTTEIDAATPAPAGKSATRNPAAADVAGTARDSHAGAASPAAPPHDPAHTERLRRELAQRIERIMAHRKPAGDAG